MADAHILVVVEQSAQAKGGQQRAGVGIRQHHGVGAGHLLNVGQEHVGEVEDDPVQHDAGDDLVDVAVGLQQAGDGAQQRAARHGQQHAGKPAPSPRQRGVEAQCHARAVLAGGADVEKAHLIGEQNGQGAHQQRRGLDQRVAQIFHLGIGAGCTSGSSS